MTGLREYQSMGQRAISGNYVLSITQGLSAKGGPQDDNFYSFESELCSTASIVSGQRID